MEDKRLKFDSDFIYGYNTDGSFEDFTSIEKDKVTLSDGREATVYHWHKEDDTFYVCDGYGYIVGNGIIGRFSTKIEYNSSLEFRFMRD